MGSTVVRHDPTSVPGDLLRSTSAVGSFGAVSRPLDRRLLGSVAGPDGGTPLPVRDVLAVAALVALADFSGGRELYVGTAVGPDRGAAEGSPRGLTMALTERDSLRTLAARVPSAVLEEDEPGFLVLVTVDRPADPTVPAPGLELVLAFETGDPADERPGQLLVRYAEDLYEPDTARQLADHTVTVLEALRADPDRPVAEALRPALDEALGFLPGHPGDPLPDELFRPGDLVRDWVRRTPDATALLDLAGESLTYAQLGSVATNLAARLNAVDGSGAPVAVLAPDNRTAAVAMVACQFAGRCYVMIDPEVPESRNTALMTAARCGVLLYDPAVRETAVALGAAVGLDTVAYAEERDGKGVPTGEGRQADDGEPNDGAPAPRAAGPDTAYIAFTSGTTGLPKGVVQPERSFALFLAWQRAQLGLGPGSRVAMWSAPVFDACYMEVFGALAYGATLCVPPAGERRDPEAVAAWLSAAEVTFFQGIPSFIEYVVAALEARPRPMASVENVIVAGEVFPPALGRRMRAVLPSARVHNMFGPTECVLATRYEIPAGHADHRRVPVGLPISGRRLLLTDEQGLPVPRGAVGEIGIVSRFLSSGYIGDEARTSSRFRPLDDGSEQGTTVYRTGDFGRVGPDGLLRYLGRRDAQIKVRGIRVNLDEVEAVLAVQPGVARCKVVDVRVAAGHVQLVAFVQPEGDGSAAGAAAALADPESAARWRSCIGEALGPRVAPTRYVVVRAFPQTATGKPDLGRMRLINEELRAARPAPPPNAPAAVPAPGAALRERIRFAAEQAAGREVRDDEDLLATSPDPLLLALRLRKSLLTHCPGLFDGVDPRKHPSVLALETAAASGASSGSAG
ncbi:amino acid adenylation domain-containing protein [Kitasatospora purpeofusca]|uniref:amino acid adenylation domain-containing protein n=1 Tax=Kitasatospora purpeofusca TaxID=67352 RepID=UPI0035DDEFA9